MDYEILFLKSLALTIFIESLVLVVFFRLIVRNEHISINQLLSTGLIASLATLPYLWFILPVYVDQKLWYIVIGESSAVLMETFIIGGMLRATLLQSFLSSLTCNLISFLIGLTINWA